MSLREWVAVTVLPVFVLALVMLGWLAARGNQKAQAVIEALATGGASLLKNKDDSRG